MGLMFPRLAKNFAKNGYFPTDEVTLARTLQAIDTNAENVAILDPCCGEGVALAELEHSLSETGATVQAYGVEYDAERAWHAKQMLDVVAHADVHDMAIKPRQFGALFLNPPYGDLVADKAELDAASGGRKRLEKVFFRRSHPWLAMDGVLILIIPHYTLDSEFAAMIAKSYKDVQIFMAPEDKFKQCVILGVKRRADRLDPALASRLEAVGRGQLPPVLPEHWSAEPYTVPALRESIHFVASRIDAKELEDEISRIHKSTLWPQFATQFCATSQVHRPPLRNLTDWHLALALAAGQISGIVTSKLGRVLLVKGDTYKDRSLKVTVEEVGSKGETREVRTFTDKFVPAIRAIDFTVGGMYGHMVTIQ
jgi:tRNA1(Val) A37 N6-methylase TrmN6